ncbi:MAG: hypothetical protein K1X72_19220 [Pyrinomonadaceae bacterium]|nr:hypothetical protein [Pyrinomonadaceae bacterium]
MKNLFVRLSVAFCAFLVGILINSITPFFTQLPQIEVASDSIEIYCPTNNKIEIEYKYTLIGKENKTAVFEVTNYSKESVYYYGFGRNSNLHSWINQNGKEIFETSYPCWMGTEEQELKPNESAIFEMPVPHNRKPFEAGFDFKRKNEEWKTFWVKVEKPNMFIQN